MVAGASNEGVPSSSAEAAVQGEPAPRTLPPAPAAGVLGMWRRRMLEQVLWMAWLVLSVALLFLAREAWSTGSWTRACWILGAWSLVGAAACMPRLDLRLRGAGLFVGITIASLNTLLYGGFHAPNGFLGMLMASVLIALAFGRRAAWLALAASVLCTAGAAALFVSGAQQVQEPVLFDLRLAGNWARVLGLFTAVSGGTLFCVSYVTERLERAMLGSQTLLDALAGESQQRLEALERQRTLFQQLQHAQKLESIGVLTGGVAHDFNNLLLVILSHAELMQRRRALPGGAASGAAAAAQDASLKAIEESARRATELTRQLLAFSRRQAAGHATFELDAAVESALGLIRRLLPASIELAYTPSGQKVTLFGAQVELDQVVMNLCVNARDAMPDGGKLTVSTALATRANTAGQPAQYACIAVRDSGTGMSAEQRARIFDPFFTTKPPERGTGLGLSVVQGIVAQWSGLIEVDSTPGDGTEMRVYLPRSESAAHIAATAAAPISALRGRETVLLADDEPRVCTVTEAILSDAGYRVFTCADGVEALERFRAAPAAIALLITDAVMPRMGGRELYETIAAERPELPCLICSGYDANIVLDDFLAPGKREFLQKPFTADELLGRIRRLLDATAPASAERARAASPFLPRGSKAR